MPNNDQPLQFPVKGLHVTREVGEQPALTTADAVNVASKDSIAGRLRGGSRAGFTKYVAEQSPEGSVRIQHLEIIVDPKNEALPQNFHTPEDDWVLDPRTGIWIPPGGAPWQPTPHAGQPSGPGEGSGSVVAMGDIQGEGEGSSTPPVEHHLWMISINYGSGFGDLDLDPGHFDDSLCDDDVLTLPWAGTDVSYSDMSTKPAVHAILVAQGYVGGSTDPNAVIASIDLTDLGIC